MLYKALTDKHSLKKIEGMSVIINIQYLFQVYMQIINVYAHCIWWGFDTYELVTKLYLTQCFHQFFPLFSMHQKY